LKYSIYPEFDEVVDVYNRSLDYGWALFQQTIPLLDKIKARQQEGGRASYYSKLDDPRLGERSNFTRQASTCCIGMSHAPRAAHSKSYEEKR
jgi:hypothetical protein